ncbi:MAG: indole-3-glycerol phosphate synthase TrpC [Proteobacteria bacterium]|nr:indole-3-glycerol phosphate synthase TrpC [Pseudomonadota bacterium]
MNILEKIVNDKKIEVSKNLGHIDEPSLEKKSADTRTPLDFKAALRRKGLSIISEVKKASPSKGLIREDFDPLEIARSYEKHGTDCISVLTEEKYFQGHPDFLSTIKKYSGVPLLRKDFIVDKRQIRESYDLGADAVLLIVGVLSKEHLLRYQQLAKEFGLTCLVEVHTLQELEDALACDCDPIGINNRNLTTFKTDIRHSIEIKKQIPSSVTCVSESGIDTAEDCRLLSEHGFDAILVGETLMRKPDPGSYIPELLNLCR